MKLCSRCAWRDDCSGDCLSGGDRRNVNMRRCPVCGKEYSEYPALSRKDNKTEICPSCGVREAIEAMNEHLESLKVSE